MTSLIWLIWSFLVCILIENSFQSFTANTNYITFLLLLLTWEIKTEVNFFLYYGQYFFFDGLGL